MKLFLQYFFIGTFLGVTTMTIFVAVHNHKTEQAWRHQTGQQLREIEARLHKLEHEKQEYAE